MALITKLNNIATAIGEKTGQPASTYTLDNMPAAIRSIVTDFPVVPDPNPKLVRFIDYDGTIVTQMSLSEAHELTALPTLPSHEDLQGVGWTSNLETVQAVTDSLDVGAMYISTVTSPTGVVPTVLKVCPSLATITLNFVQSQANGVTVDWGDNTTPQTASGTSVTLNHTYTAANVFYTITLTPDSGVTLTLGLGTQATRTLNQSSGADNQMHVEIVLGECAVNSYGFANIKGVRSLVMSNMVSAIGRNAFYGCSMPSAIIPSSLTTFGGESVFSYCSCLKNVVIPSSFTDIPAACFYNCVSLADIVIPNSVTSIGNNAFQYDALLTSVVIPNSVTFFGTGVFNSTSLETIVLPNTISNFNTTFASCHFKTFIFPNNVTSIPNSMFQYNYGLESVTMPDTITSIGQYSFSNCFSLTSMVLPSSVTSMGRSCFEYCYSLESITLPASYTTGAQNMFYQCYNLKTIVFKDRASIPANAFANGYVYTLNNHITKLDFTEFTQVPTLVNATNFFAGMPADTKIVVPDSLYADWIAASGWSSKASQIVKESLYTE